MLEIFPRARGKKKIVAAPAVDCLSMQDAAMVARAGTELQGVEVVVDNPDASVAAGPVGGDEDRTCVVCFEAPRDAVLIPCGHAVTCMACARKIAETSDICPMCRAVIKEAKKIGVEHQNPDGTVVMTSLGGFTVA